MKPAEYLRDLYSMEGKVVLIAGASSGIGSHLAEVFAKAGGSVILGARRAERIEARATEIAEKTGQKAMAVSLDVTDGASVTAAFDAAEASFGTPDVILNNAGVANPKWALEDTEEDFDFVVNTNTKGMWRVAQEAAKRLNAAGKPGSIINTASILGLGVGPQQATYSISKGAVVHMTKALGIEFQRFGVRVNCICPGYFYTEINDKFLDSELGQKMLKVTPAKRAGRLEELASAYLMLAGDGASFINGVALPVDCGHSIKLV